MFSKKFKILKDYFLARHEYFTWDLSKKLNFVTNNAIYYNT